MFTSFYIYIYNVGKHQWRLCVCQCGNASNHRRDGELGKNIFQQDLRSKGLFIPEFVHDSCELFILNIFFSCGHGAHNSTVAIGIAKRLEGMTKGL